MSTPKPHAGLHHVALFIKNFESCENFYVNILGMKIVWRPDSDNLYLSSGNDNLALHRAPQEFEAQKNQRLDHLGFFLTDQSDVQNWYEYLKDAGVEIKAEPKQHRDGTTSFYCSDPDGNVVQMIHMSAASLGK